jgi:hypothetical protein
MKKILMVAALLLIAAGAATAFFIVNFDSERCRSWIENKVGELAGYPVRLDKVSLGWEKGLAIKVENFRVFPSKGAGQPSAEIQECAGSLDLWAILRQKIEIGAVTLKRCNVRVSRKADGRLVLTGPAREEKPARETKAGATALLPLLIGQIRVEEGAFLYLDESLNPPLGVAVQALDLALKDIAWNHPVDFSSSFGLYHSQKNIRVDGKFVLPIPGRASEIRSLRVQADLNPMDLSAVEKSLPALSDFGINRDLRGKIEGTAEKLILPDVFAKDIAGAIRVKDGQIRFKQFPDPLVSVDAEIIFKGGRIDVRSLAFSTAGGRVIASGNVDQYRIRPVFSLDMKIDGLDLDRAMASTSPEGVRFGGMLSGVIRMAGQGRLPAEIGDSLGGAGQVAVKKPLIYNLNILRELFARMSVIPGAVERLLKNLPASYQDQLRQRHTALEDIDQSFRVENGRLVAPDFRIATPNFVVTGVAEITARGALSAQTMVSIEPKLSAAFIRSVRELQFLTDESGSIRFPVRCQGNLPGNVSVMPDVSYVASKLAVEKAAELLSGFLDKQNKKKSPSTAASPSQTATQAAGSSQNQTSSGDGASTKSPEEMLLDTVLGGLFGSQSKSSQ